MKSNIAMGHINDIFKFDEDTIKSDKIKIRFLLDNGVVDPIEVYLTDKSKIENDWTLYNGKRSLFRNGEIVLSFVRKGRLWLFVTAKRIIGHDGQNHYIGEDIPEYRWLCGRLLVSYWNKSQNLVRRYSGLYNDVVIHSILDDAYAGERFPGYDKVDISFIRLEQIIRNQVIDWITALSNEKAVYLITDMKSNKLYVGSATSENGMLLGRWSQYIENGHGGNVELKKLDFEYIRRNFKYSILSHFSSNISDSDILECEQRWKLRLRSKEVGYNGN